MLLSVIVAFFICILPFRVVSVWMMYVKPSTLIDMGLVGYYHLMNFVRVMFYLNSACNPVLYNVFSSNFRQAFASHCRGGSGGDLEAPAFRRQGTQYTSVYSNGRAVYSSAQMSLRSETTTTTTSAAAATPSSLTDDVTYAANMAECERPSKLGTLIEEEDDVAKLECGNKLHHIRGKAPTEHEM